MNAAHLPDRKSTFIHRIVWMGLLVALGLMPVFPAEAETDMLITYREGIRSTDQKQLMDELARRMNEMYPSGDWTSEDMFSDQADLNGDGVVEVFVSMTRQPNCGTDRRCITSIYQKRKTGWAYIGRKRSQEAVYFRGQTLKVEDTWSNGWRTITNGEYRSCFVAPGLDHPKILDEDPLGMPVDPNASGYIWSVPVSEPCPETIPE